MKISSFTPYQNILSARYHVGIFAIAHEDYIYILNTKILINKKLRADIRWIGYGSKRCMKILFVLLFVYIVLLSYLPF